MSIRPNDEEKSRAFARVFEKLDRKQQLTPEESRLMAEVIGTMLAYLAHGAAKLVKPAIDRLASPDTRAALDQLARRVDEHAKALDRHHADIDAEHRPE
jgi:predicted lipoprotein